MDEQLRQATLGAGSIQTPGSPLGSFPELSQLYQSSFQLPQSSGAANALAGQAKDTVSRAKTKKSNYQKIKKADGGFDFYDGEGKPISAYDYANATGVKASEVLSDSENPTDIGYLQDYKNLQDYMEAKFNAKGNSKSAAKAKQIEASIKQSFGIDVANMNPASLIDQFKNAYPTIYGRSNNGVPAGQTFVSSYNNEEDQYDPSNPGGGGISQ